MYGYFISGGEEGKHPRQSRSGGVCYLPVAVAAGHNTRAIGAVRPPNRASSRRPVDSRSDGPDYFWFRAVGRSASAGRGLRPSR